MRKLVKILICTLCAFILVVSVTACNGNGGTTYKVNVASVAGVYGNANMSVYSTTKGAVISMTKALAKEVVEKGIVVNCVSPGMVSPSDNPDIEYTNPTEACYAGRTGSDRENADLICFLASEKNGYVVGQNIQIDGCRRRV